MCWWDVKPYLINQLIVSVPVECNIGEMHRHSIITALFVCSKQMTMHHIMKDMSLIFYL